VVVPQVPQVLPAVGQAPEFVEHVTVVPHVLQ
jgi:hypothetical protein